jgi:radical SAM protein with 4Fe4S-binding SPASM domain
MYYDNMDLKKRFSDAETRKVVTEGLIRSVEAYCRLTAPPTHPRAILERAFLRHARSFLRTGRTPLPCHALRSSCFVDPTGEVYPCITFNRSLGNLRDHGYDLSRLWNSEQAVVLQKKIWSLECPQCWTGCDGYQTIMGNLFRRAR